MDWARTASGSWSTIPVTKAKIRLLFEFLTFIKSGLG
jgi:hypothetical protein